MTFLLRKRMIVNNITPMINPLIGKHTGKDFKSHREQKING